MLRLFRKKPKAKTYPLEDIATIWCDPDVSKAFTKTGDIEDNGPGEFQGRNQKINLFWKQFIQRYQRNILAVPGLIELIKTLSTELDENPERSSIDPEDHEIQERYHVLKDVSLLNHTLTVTQAMIDLAETSANDFQMIVGKLIVVGLAHDMGILHKRIPNAGHSINSVSFLEDMVFGLRNPREIFDAIKMHHLPKDQIRIKNPILDILIIADTKVRELELKRFESNTARKQPDNAKQHQEEDTKTLTADNKDGAEKQDIGFQLQDLADRIQKVVRQKSLDALVFKEKVYLRPNVLRDILSDISSPEHVAGHKIEDLISPELGFASARIRLHYKSDKGQNASKPQLYFITESKNIPGFDTMKAVHPCNKAGKSLEKIEQLTAP